MNVALARCYLAGLAGLLLFAACQRYPGKDGYAGLILLENIRAATDQATPTLEMLPPGLPPGIALASVDSGQVLLTGLIPGQGVKDTIIPVGPVDTANAFVLCFARNDETQQVSQPSCQLTSDGSIAVRPGPWTVQTVLNWFLVKFNEGGSVQRGTGVLPPPTMNRDIPITPVDPDHAFVLVQPSAPHTKVNADPRRLLSGSLRQPGLLRLQRGSVGTTVVYDWQVIEHPGFRVQSGIYSMSGALETIPIQPVDTRRSFLQLTMQVQGSLNGEELRYLVRGSIDRPDRITFQRNNKNVPVRIAWFVIELSQGSVQSGSVQLPVDGVTDVALPARVDTGRTFPLFSTGIPVDLGEVTFDNLSAGSVSVDFLDGHTMRFQRGAAEDVRAAVNWFAVEM